MTKLIAILAATLALGLTSELAYAQTASGPDAATASPVVAPADQNQMVAAGPTNDAMQVRTDSTVTAPSGATITHKLISNPPVPDTPANRAKYGQPLSDTGRHTQPAGN